MYNPVSPAEAERLTILIEECSEVIKEATKILRHGYLAHDKGITYDNRFALETEIGDTLNAIDMMYEAKDIAMKTIQQRVAYKRFHGVITHHQPPRRGR